MVIHGATPEGEEHIYDVFVRNDPSLSRPLLAWMTVMDATVIGVSLNSVEYHEYIAAMI